MPRKINVALVAKRQNTSARIAGQLETLLGESIDITRFSLEKGLDPFIENAELILVSMASITKDVAEHVSTGAEILIVQRTLRKESWAKILGIPAGTHAMLVNDDRDSALETIAMLHELGAKHLILEPYYPGLTTVPPLSIAITPGEVHLVPSTVQRIIDIGDRVVDAGTIADILTKLNLFDEKAHQKLSRYMDDIITRSPGLSMSLSWLRNIESQREVLFDLVREGIIVFDAQGKIALLNKPAEQMLSMKAWEAIGKPVEEVLFSFSGVRTQDLEELWKKEDREFIVRGAEVRKNGHLSCGIVTLEDITALRELESQLKGELRTRGHAARYEFSDIIGTSPALLEAVSKAKKLARSSSSILLHGESGTGKELFAHAIHNCSNRRTYPFVAVNCAALPETLLESELFGYEEGAFTGARRGGKAGLFEQSHKGTIFLDEVGDISWSVQARLLRVIQEKEVLRVGATRVRHVDVRIIAATNRDLHKMVREGAFRADLYHRLSALPIRIPSLRERVEDIPVLARHFLEKLGVPSEIPQDVIRCLMEYDWPGNVRELENCIGYMVALSDGTTLAPEHLPDSIKNISDSYQENDSLRALGPPAELIFILTELHKAKLGQGRLGRRSLSRKATLAGIPLTPNEVRTLLEKLASAGFVTRKRGRGGTQINEQGIALLRQMRKV